MKNRAMTVAGLVLSAYMTAQAGSTPATQQIEVEVRFMEISESATNQARALWEFGSASSKTVVTADMTNTLRALEQSGGFDLLSAPKVLAESGEKATIKVVTEYIYPTCFEVKQVSITNGAAISQGVAVVPGNFETREVGIMLDVTPVFDASSKMIDLSLTAEVVSDPTWKEYTVTYEGADGKKKTMATQQPCFHARKIQTSMSLHNNETVIMGGMIDTRTKRVEDRVPILGTIPGLGRLFRRSHEIKEKRKLLIAVTAKTAGEN